MRRDADVTNTKKRAKSKGAPVQQATPPRELLDAILAAPDDDEVRLVLADWLTEHGDPLGEFIQVQCMLGRALPAESRQELAAREKELKKKYERIWIAPYRAHMRSWKMRRGFVHHVNADINMFLKGLDALCEVPFTSVQLTGFRAPLAAPLSRARRHPTLRSIDFSRNGIGAKRVGVMTAPLFQHARTLTLSANKLAEAGLAQLAELAFPELLELELSRVDATPRGIELLSRAPFFSRLESLVLLGNEKLDASIVPALERATSLVSLDVCTTSIGDEGVRAIASSRALGRLRELAPPYGLSEETERIVAERFPASS
jgi:uncharacterized protein (TIGR02996 family)